MQNFKLKNKGKEQKNLKQQKKNHESAKQNKKLNVFEKNNKTTGALIMGIIAIIIMFIPKGGFASIIIVIFAARRLLKAKKINENKKYLNITYVIVYLPVIVWIVSSIIFSYSKLS